MELTLQSDQEVALLSRRNVAFMVSFEKETPSYQALQPELAKALNSPQDCIKILSLRQHFGQRKAQVLLHVYPSLQQLELVEVVKNKKYKKAKEEEHKKMLEQKKAQAPLGEDHGKEKSKE